MAKVAEWKWVPTTYFPKKKQYNRSGISLYYNGVPLNIGPTGHTPSSPEEQEYIESLIKRDPFCGIARHGEQEMSSDAKKAVTESIQLKHENDQLRAELARMKERAVLHAAAGGKGQGE